MFYASTIAAAASAVFRGMNLHEILRQHLLPIHDGELFVA